MSGLIFLTVNVMVTILIAIVQLSCTVSIVVQNMFASRNISPLASKTIYIEKAF